MASDDEKEQELDELMKELGMNENVSEKLINNSHSLNISSVEDAKMLKELQQILGSEGASKSDEEDAKMLKELQQILGSAEEVPGNVVKDPKLVKGVNNSKDREM